MVTLLQTKLYIPPQPTEFVPRPHLLQKLNAAFAPTTSLTLTLISAPAGFGKSSLVAEWIQHMKAHAAQLDLSPSTSHFSPAWLSLEADDNDPYRFLAYLVAALQTIPSLAAAKIGVGVQTMLQSSQPPTPLMTLTILLNDLHSANTAVPILIVLDDYHCIKTPAIHEAVTFLLEHAPAALHLVLISRTDPPLPLARLRARRQMIEIRAADLRFTEAETAVFFNEIMGLNLAATDITALAQRTEGWITGVQLAAISLQGRADIGSFVQAFTGSHRFILDYLVEEVLQTQPAIIQQFLLQTAVLEQLHGPLCDAVVGMEDWHLETNTDPSPIPPSPSLSGTQILAELERVNLFIVPLDDERRWYRYHHLFADLLRARLQQLHPELIPTLHRRAAAWYAEAGYRAQAVHHALTGSDFEYAAQLIEQVGIDLTARGELGTLQTWLHALPDTLLRERPWLSIYASWASFLTGQIETMIHHLQTAAAAVPAVDTVETRSMRGHIAALRASLAIQNREMEHVTTLCQEALNLLPADDLLVRSFMTFTLGGIYMLMDQLELAQEMFVRASQLGLTSDNISIAIPSMCARSQILMANGRLHDAFALLQQALTTGQRAGERPYPIAANVYKYLANIYYEWNDLENALHYAQLCVDLAQQWQNIDVLLPGFFTLAQVTYTLYEDKDAVHALIQQAADSTLERYLSPETMLYYHMNRAQLHLALGELAAANQWTNTQAIQRDLPITYLSEQVFITLAQIYLARTDYTEADHVLIRLRKAAEANGRFGSLITIDILQAQSAQMQGRLDQAQNHLLNALEGAEQEGYIRQFLDWGAPMAVLLRRIPDTSPVSPYAHKLLRQFSPDPDTDAENLPHTLAQTPLDALSEREMEVLRLIAQGYSNQDIAEALVVTVGTVKSHTNHIYSKLGVRTRTQAIAEGRSRGLL